MYGPRTVSDMHRRLEGSGALLELPKNETETGCMSACLDGVVVEARVDKPVHELRLAAALWVLIGYDHPDLAGLQVEVLVTLLRHKIGPSQRAMGTGPKAVTPCSSHGAIWGAGCKASQAWRQSGRTSCSSSSPS